MSLQNKPKPLILIVDDEKSTLQLLKTILQKASYNVVCATNGTEVLNYVEKNIPDMILLDIIMPDINGFDICTQLKKTPHTKDIPIIFITAKSDAEFITKGFQCGAEDYIKKPYLQEEILARVKTVFRNIWIENKLKHVNKKLEKQVKRKTEDLTAVLKILQLGYRYTTIDDILDKIVIIIFSSIRVEEINLVEINFEDKNHFIGKNIENSISFNKSFNINSGKSGNLKLNFQHNYYTEEGEIDNILTILVNEIVSIIEFIEEEEIAKKSGDLTQAILSCSSDGIVVVDLKQKVLITNPSFSEIFGYNNNELVGKDFNKTIALKSLIGKEPDVFSIIDETGEAHISEKRQMKNGKESIFSITGTSLIIQGVKHGYLLFYRDISEKLKLESELMQEDKIKAIGQLSSGIAHEINSPIQYIKNNLEFLKDSFSEIVKLIDNIDNKFNTENISNSELFKNILEQINKIDLDYLKKEIVLALDESLDGVNRITEIVNAMRTFSHPGGLENDEVNLQDVIEKIIIVSRNEWKYDSEIETEFEPGLVVPAHKDKISQIVINLIINAVHAIQAKGSQEKGLIKIKTICNGNIFVEIHVSDNGTGIPEDIRDRIFEPFFTTKEIGKGTGQGLAMVYNLVTNNYNGQLNFETEIGKGTTFIVRLPLLSNNKEEE